MEKNLYAEIIVDNTSSNTDKLFTYSVPEMFMKKVEIGMRVLVPFGRGDKLLEGVVLNLKTSISFPASRLKKIQNLVDESSTISRDMLKLSEWMKEE